MPSTRLDSSELISSVALLVIDAQDAFIAALSNRDAFVQRCAFAIDAAQLLGIRTLFTEQVPDKLGHTSPKLLRRVSNPKIFHKTSFSALNAPGIEGFLRENEIYHVLVCGLETPICIYQTGLQAVDEDIDTTFLSDALGCRRVQDHGVAIQALRVLGCQVLPSETVFYSLLGGADHPQFKALSNLVKTFSDPQFSLQEYLNQAPPRSEATQEKHPQKRSKSRRSRSHSKERTQGSDTSGFSPKSPRATEEKPNSGSSNRKPRNPRRQSASANETSDPNRPKPAAPPKKQAKKAPRKRVAKKVAKNSSPKKPD